MAKVCEICGKHTTFGNTIARRGLAKYLGGVGVKRTGVSRRRFQANVQKVRVEIGGSVRRAKVCTRCLKSGKIQKPRIREIPENILAAMKAREEGKRPENRRKAAKQRREQRAQKLKARAAKTQALKSKKK